jgi:hypothetical protein
MRVARSTGSSGRRLVRILGRLLGALLGLVLLAVVALSVVARTSWARAQVARGAEKAFAQAGVHATFDDARLELPPGVVLQNVRVPSTEAGPPFLEAKSARIRFRTKPLLRGRFEASTVDIDAPEVRARVSGGKVVGFAGPEAKARGAPWPFDALNVRNGKVEVTGADVRLRTDGVEATARAQEGGGQVGLHASRGDVEQKEHGASICALDAALSFRPGAILVADLHATAAGTAECSPADAVSLAVDRARVHTEADGTPSQAEGHVHAHGAVALLERFVRSPHLEGALDFDGDVRIAAGWTLPELRGRFDAFDLVIGSVQVARSLHGRIETAGDQVIVPEATLDTIEGEARLSHVSIRPLAPGIPVRGRVDGEHVRFGDFLRGLGVAHHPHVAWDLDRVRWHAIAGTLAPFVLVGDLRLQTGAFTVCDGPCDLRRSERIWRVRRATIAGQARLDAAGFEVRDVRAAVPDGQVVADRVLIGFRDDVLRVEGGRVRLALQDVSPLASLALDGNLRADVSAYGRLDDPLVNVEGAIDHFDLDHHPLGDIRSLRARYRREVVWFEDVHAHSGSTDYDVESVRIAVPARGRVDVDAIVSAKAAKVRDVLPSLRLAEEPNLASLVGSLRDARARLRYVHGGSQDPLGQGTVFVNVRTRLDKPSMLGQRFDEGAIDLDARWWDRRPEAGLSGVDIDLHSLVLRDVGEDEEAGSVVASGGLAAGGLAVSASANLPLARLVPAARTAAAVQGRVSGHARAKGRLDAVHVVADVLATQTRVGGIPLGSSSLQVDGTFGGNVPPRAVARGELLGGQVAVDGLAFEGPQGRGQIELRDLDVAALLQAASHARRGETAGASSGAGAWVSGDLSVSELDLRDPAHGCVTFVPTAAQAILGGQSVRLRSNGSRVVLANDRITIPTLTFDLGPTGQPAAIATMHASIASLSREPEIDAALAAPSTPMRLLVGPVPGLQSAEGTVSLALWARGRLRSPTLGGRLKVRATSATIGWLPDELRDVDIDVAIDRGLTVERARARLGHGTIDLTGSAPIDGPVPAVGDFGLRAKGLRLPVGKNVFVMVDASTRLLVDVPQLLGGRPHSAILTGTIDLHKTNYKLFRVIPIDLTGLTPLAPLLASSPKNARPGAGIVDLDLGVHVHEGVPHGVISLVGAILPIPRHFWLRGTNDAPRVVSAKDAGRTKWPASVRFEL